MKSSWLPIVAIIVGLSAVAAADSPPIHHQPDPAELESTHGIVPIPLFEVEAMEEVLPAPRIDFVFDVATPQFGDRFEFLQGFEPQPEHVWRSIDPGVDQSREFCRSL